MLEAPANEENRHMEGSKRQQSVSFVYGQRADPPTTAFVVPLPVCALAPSHILLHG